MLLTGTYARTLDDKYRIALPKPLKDAFIGTGSAKLYLAPGTDGSLTLYTEESFGKLASQLSDRSPTQQDVRDFSRLLYAQTQQVDLDRQGRMRVPAEMAKLAGLEKEAVLLGVKDHVEIWDRSRWTIYLAEKSARYDQIAEAAFRSVE